MITKQPPEPQLPPHSDDAEKALLGGLLVEGERAGEVVSAIRVLVRAEDFFDPAHGLLFAAICALDDAGLPPAPPLLVRECEQRGTLAAIGGRDRLLELIECGHGTTSAETYARIVHDRSVARQVIQLAHRVASEARDGRDGAEVLEGLERGLLAISNTAQPIPDFVAELARRIRRDWPGWGTRRIAGILMRMGIQVSRTSVQTFLCRPGRPSKASAHPVTGAGHVVAKYPAHLWFLDFTKVGNALRSVFVGAVIDGYSRKILAVGVWPQEPTAIFAARLLREAVASAGKAPRWMVTDHGKQFMAGRFLRALRRRRIGHRYGKVHRHGSLAVIERFWKAFKAEHAGRLALYRPVGSIERSLKAYATWFNEHRPHQGLGQRTPNEVHFGTSTRVNSVPLRAVLEAEPVAGDRYLPVLRLRAVA